MSYDFTNFCQAPAEEVAALQNHITFRKNTILLIVYWRTIPNARWESTTSHLHEMGELESHLKFKSYTHRRQPWWQNQPRLPKWALTSPATEPTEKKRIDPALWIASLRRARNEEEPARSDLHLWILALIKFTIIINYKLVIIIIVVIINLIIIIFNIIDRYYYY